MTSTGFTESQSTDSVLKIVEDYRNLDKGIECIEMIYTFVIENFFKQQWTPEYEKLLIIMIDLSLKHRRHDVLNECLKTYKKICEKHNFESLFSVFNHYIYTL